MADGDGRLRCIRNGWNTAASGRLEELTGGLDALPDLAELLGRAIVPDPPAALKDGGVINEGTIFPVRKKNPKQGYAYHVPYRAILPRRRECDNLLVPVALSCTHVGMSSLRIDINPPV